MHSHQNTSLISIMNAPITIRDHVVVGLKDPSSNRFPCGEFRKEDRQGSNGDESSETMINRLFDYISSLVSVVSKQHRQDNCYPESNELLPDKKNYITRLLTNEFFFYSVRPLTLDEFQNLQQKIADFAKILPENLHLILGTFAVKTPSNKVMNVAAHIGCGKTPKFNFTLKNKSNANKAAADPVYLESLNETETINLINVDWAHQDEISKLKIMINNQNYPLSFNNVFQCNTAGGASFYSLIDLCCDAEYDKDHQSVARDNLERQIELVTANTENSDKTALLSTQYAYCVLSNWIDLYKDRFFKICTHADPKCSPMGCITGVSQKAQPLEKPLFGSFACMYVTEPVRCSNIPDIQLLTKIEKHNTKIMNTEESWRQYVALVHIAEQIWHNWQAGGTSSQSKDYINNNLFTVYHGILALLKQHDIPTSTRVFHNGVRKTSKTDTINNLLYILETFIDKEFGEQSVERMNYKSGIDKLKEYYNSTYGSSFYKSKTEIRNQFIKKIQEVVSLWQTQTIPTEIPSDVPKISQIVKKWNPNNAESTKEIFNTLQTFGMQRISIQNNQDPALTKLYKALAQSSENELNNVKRLIGGHYTSPPVVRRANTFS